MGRRVRLEGWKSQVREIREGQGLSQAELARRAGLSRQALSAIEAGRYLPNVAVALRLAQALSCQVEDLFPASSAGRIVEAEGPLLAGPARLGTRRVCLGRVGGRLIAWPLREAWGFHVLADGLVMEAGRPGWVRVALQVPPAVLERTLLIGGCNPALALLAAHLTERFPEYRLRWIPMNSQAALRALARGELHIAGTHLGDPVRGMDNLPAIRRTLAGRPVVVVTLARWVEGVMLPAGNPERIRRLQDLARPGLRVLLRERGAGSQRVLVWRLRQEGIPPSVLPGLRWRARDHLEVAAALAARLADAGPGVLPVARIFGLGFLPLAESRYDLVIPEAFFRTPAVETFLEALSGRCFREELEAIGGFDPHPAGTLVARLGT
jgi:molybdate-binding protein/DNA-binding XRE family transcriptional regulator